MPQRKPSASAEFLSYANLRPGERIGVAVSGGADSVALLHLLLEARKKLGFVLAVVHFNHKLRGKASDGDEQFVAALAKKHALEFFRASEDVAAKSRREKINLEDAARRARYAFFTQLVADGKVHRVAVAHTADDQAETVLAHILRGTGLAGLAGIHPEAGVVFRPLLHARRADLRKYLRSRKQAWREDKTNRDMARNRARIRLKLMPLLEHEFQPKIVAHLCQLAELAREDDAFLESKALIVGKLLAEHEEHSGKPRGTRIPLAEFLTQPRAMQSRLIRLLVAAKKPKELAGQLGAAHVAAVLRLAQDQDSGKALPLPGGVEVRRDRDSLHFLPANSAWPKDGNDTSAAKEYRYPVDLRGGSAEVPVVALSLVLRFRVIDWPSKGRETINTGAARNVVLDREKLRSPFVVRNWRPGDAMRPQGHQKRHTLARLLNEIGVSRWEKASWPVLALRDTVIWTRGLPVATEFAAGRETREGVLIVEEKLT